MASLSTENELKKGILTLKKEDTINSNRTVKMKRIMAQLYKESLKTKYKLM